MLAPIIVAMGPAHLGPDSCIDRTVCKFANCDQKELAVIGWLPSLIPSLS